MNTRKMICIHASNLLENAPFKKGEEYNAVRDEDKNVFVKDSLGMNMQVNLSTFDNKTVWKYSDECIGVFFFEIMK